MLKTVIQKKNVDGLLRFEPVTLGEAVFAHAKRDAALQTEFHQLDFVACAVRASVTAAQNRNTLSISEKFLGEPNHHGCFARAANGQIPDADDSRFEAFLLEPSVGIQPNTRANSDTIEQRERPQQSPQ
jgi:hypothetical protein